MFGYIVCNQSEMKFKEYDEYHKYYCGLCRGLRNRYGVKGQLSLSYDMTFLIMLLTGLYEPEEAAGTGRCIPHPVKKHRYTMNRYTEYVADMNVILTYYKCQDDWTDERKVIRKLYSDILLSKKSEVRKKYMEKIKIIRDNLEAISGLEKQDSSDIDCLAGHFGKVMAEICSPEKDEWDKELRAIGYHLGRFIYIMDAYDDLEKDVRSKNFNPLISRLKYINDKSSMNVSESVSEDMSHDLPLDIEQVDVEAWKGFARWTRDALAMDASSCARAFEQLPIIKNVEILRNILYSGIWNAYINRTRKRIGEENIE